LIIAKQALVMHSLSCFTVYQEWPFGYFLAFFLFYACLLFAGFHHYYVPHMYASCMLLLAAVWLLNLHSSSCLHNLLRLEHVPSLLSSFDIMYSSPYLPGALCKLNGTAPLSTVP